MRVHAKLCRQMNPVNNIYVTTRLSAILFR
jgi:hypothetical protein